jgi:hypothetical protein
MLVCDTQRVLLICIHSYTACVSYRETRSPTSGAPFISSAGVSHDTHTPLPVRYLIYAPSIYCKEGFLYTRAPPGRYTPYSAHAVCILQGAHIMANARSLAHLPQTLRSAASASAVFPSVHRPRQLISYTVVSQYPF